ncbi:MAG: hypothetical protein KJO07_07285, partial [Deltaproteobacteria bacterium]|nr:hypothetical protein [Deltaproteobacteria bacterium]
MKLKSLALVSSLTSLLLASACTTEPMEPDGRPGATGKADGTTSEYDHQIWVESVWVEKNATEGKQYLAIFKEDAYSHSEHFLMYGEKDNGTFRVRNFQSGYIIIEHPGFVEKSKDNFYDFEAEFVSDSLVKVHLEGRDGRTYDLEYEKQELTWPLINESRDALAGFYDKFDEAREQDPDSLEALKDHVDLHIRTHSHDPNEAWDAYPWQLKIHWLQIESDLVLGDANSDLAGVTIEADGSDAISQDFFAQVDGSEYTTEADLPWPEDAYDHDTWDDQPRFFVVHDSIEGIEDGPIKGGLESFAGKTIA